MTGSDGITTFRIKYPNWASFWFQAWHHGLATSYTWSFFKGYAPAIAGIWGRVGEGLPKLKILYHYLSIQDLQKKVINCILFYFLIQRLCEPKFTFCLHLAYWCQWLWFDNQQTIASAWHLSTIFELSSFNTCFVLTFSSWMYGYTSVQLPEWHHARQHCHTQWVSECSAALMSWYKFRKTIILSVAATFAIWYDKMEEGPKGRLFVCSERWPTNDQQEPTKHNAWGTWWYLECKIFVGLSFAGKNYWTQHTESAAHETNAQKARAVPTKKISSSLKITKPTPSSLASTSALIPTHIFLKLPIHQPLWPAPLPGDLHPVKFGEALSTSSTLLNQIKAAINSLPLAILVGINSDDWATFSENLPWFASMWCMSLQSPTTNRLLVMVHIYVLDIFLS